LYSCIASEFKKNFITGGLLAAGAQGNCPRCHPLIRPCRQCTGKVWGSATNRKKQLFNRLQEKRSASLIPIGCPAHILHNAAEKGVERLTADVETIVLKICSHFKSQTSRVQNLKQLCEQLEAQYTALPTHTPTRWTTLNNVLEKMIELWEPLKQHFNSLKCPARIFEDF